MTVARLDDLENCDHRNGIEFKIWSIFEVSYKDFLWFGISALEQTEEKSFLLDQRMIQVAEMMQHYRKKIQSLDVYAEEQKEGRVDAAGWGMASLLLHSPGDLCLRKITRARKAAEKGWEGGWGSGEQKKRPCLP